MIDGIRIRAATLADLPAITAIYGHAVLNGTASYEYDAPSLDEMSRRYDAIIAGSFPYLVAYSADKVLGYAYASHFRTRPAYRFMVEDSIYIAPDAQGFHQMIAVIGDAATNLASARLHALMGFAECGRIKGSGFKFNRWCDTLLMQRALNGGIDTLPV